MRKLQRLSFNLIVYETIGRMQMTLSGNLPFHGQSRKHDDIERISHLKLFSYFQTPCIKYVFVFISTRCIYFGESVMITLELPHGYTKAKRMTVNHRLLYLS